MTEQRPNRLYLALGPIAIKNYTDAVIGSGSAAVEVEFGTSFALLSSGSRDLWSSLVGFGALKAAPDNIVRQEEELTLLKTQSDLSVDHQPARLSVLVARLTWMFLGPVGIVITALLIVRLANGWFTPADALLPITLLLMLVARWYELASGHGCDGFGNPVTTAAFPKFALRCSATVVACWLIANLIGNVVAPVLN